MTRLIDRIDLSDKRKVYVVGDIHGCFHILKAKLTDLNFDEEKDFLISVGDLVDRGPYSERAIEWVAKPWFKHIIGNHEEFVEDHAKGQSYYHIVNGGQWMTKLSPEDKAKHAKILMDAPYLLEAITPKGHKVGFVHADLVGYDWQENIDDPSYPVFSWSRARINHLKYNPAASNTITGIDHVFVGHTILKKPLVRGNMTWTDTGAFAGGVLTVIDIDYWLQ